MNHCTAGVLSGCRNAGCVLGRLGPCACRPWSWPGRAGCEVDGWGSGAEWRPANVMFGSCCGWEEGGRRSSPSRWETDAGAECAVTRGLPVRFGCGATMLLEWRSGGVLRPGVMERDVERSTPGVAAPFDPGVLNDMGRTCGWATWSTCVCSCGCGLAVGPGGGMPAKSSERISSREEGGNVAGKGGARVVVVVVSAGSKMGEESVGGDFDFSSAALGSMGWASSVVKRVKGSCFGEESCPVRRGAEGVCGPSCGVGLLRSMTSGLGGAVRADIANDLAGLGGLGLALEDGMGLGPKRSLSSSSPPPPSSRPNKSSSGTESIGVGAQPVSAV